MQLKIKVVGSYFFVFIALVVIVLFSTLRSIDSLKDISYIRSNVEVSVSSMKQVKVDIIQIQNWLTDTAFTGYLSGFDTAEKYYNNAKLLIKEDIDRKNELGKSEIAAELEELQKILDEYYQLGAEMAHQYLDNGREAGNIWMEKFDLVAEELVSRTDKQVQLYETVFKTKFEELEKNQNDIILIIISSVIIFIFSIMGIYILVSLKNGVKIVSNFSEKLSENDITNSGNITRSDEFGQIALKFKKSFENLNNLMGNIKTVSNTISEVKDSLSASAEETSASIVNIKKGTAFLLDESKKMDENVSENVASVEEITANISSIQDQINEQVAMVEESTAAITEMIASLENVDSITMKKKESVMRLVTAIEGGNNASNETDVKFQVDVIDKIDGISEMANSIQNIAAQTNLLSMNAAIEAAHAGDAGRGFAVVADEIRKLADTASKSSAEITRTIKEIADGIEGTGVVAQKKKDAFVVMNKEIIETKNAFDEIVTSVHELNSGGTQIQEAMVVLQDVSSNIKNAAAEMNVGAEHVIRGQLGLKDISGNISSGMMEINSGAEEIVTAADELVNYAGELDSVVNSLKAETGKFKI